MKIKSHIRLYQKILVALTLVVLLASASSTPAIHALSV